MSQMSEDQFASMCKTKGSKNPKQTNQVMQEENQDFAFAANSKLLNKKLVCVKVGGVNLEVLPDTGASVSIVDKSTWQSLKENM